MFSVIANTFLNYQETGSVPWVGPSGFVVFGGMTSCSIRKNFKLLSARLKRRVGVWHSRHTR